MPPREPPQSAEPDLDALTRVVDRLSGFNDHLSVEWIDGYLSAVLAGPRTVLPSEWLPKMLGDAFDRAFADPPDVQQAMGALTARWNVIAMQLEPQALLDEPDALRLAPLMTDLGEELRQELRDEGVKEEDIAALPQTGAEWAWGFLQALDDFPDDWPEPDIATPEGAALDNLLMRVIALQLDEKDLQEHLLETYPGETLDRDDLIDEACLAVQDLRVYWLDHAPKPPTRRVGEKTGRNDPCPCGSGRKYKKCHGAQ